MVRSVKAADPSKPVFLFFSHGAVHAPLQAPAEAIARYRGAYDAGWDALRDQGLRRHIELGVVAAGTQLPPRNHEPDHDVAAWDGVPPDERALYARYMEVYAAMVESIDASFGRLRRALTELGSWDDTLTLFLSDNGASQEGDAWSCTITAAFDSAANRRACSSPTAIRAVGTFSTSTTACSASPTTPTAPFTTSTPAAWHPAATTPPSS